MDAFSAFACGRRHRALFVFEPYLAKVCAEVHAHALESKVGLASERQPFPCCP